MRNGFSILLLASLMFGGWFWFVAYEPTCDVPLTYRVGTIDSRFNITEPEVRAALTTAESLWENPVGKELFTYDAEGALEVRFVYDERQERADEAETLLSELERKGDMSESVRADYDRLTREYTTLKKTLDAKTDTYNAKLASYNTEVEDWNARGGAPQDVYARLEITKRELGEESTALNDQVKEFNALVRSIRALANRGNALTEAYNETIDEYNNRIGSGEEFTQGDYQKKIITIYEFTSRDELELVLAHELGHALSLDHVEGEQSIMYRAMGGQSRETGISGADIAEFRRMCGTGDPFFRRLFP